MAALLDRRARKLVERIQKNHSDHEAVEALAKHYAKAGDHASLANLMEGFGDTLQESRAAADAYVEAADAALMVSDKPRAEELYERALTREPSHSEALDRALRVAESASDYERMRRVLSGVIRAAEAAGAPRTQLATLHFRLGQLFETHLNDPDRAAGLYRIAIDHNPMLVSAMVAARRLYANAGNHAAVSVLYEFEIEAAKLDEDKRALLVALADHRRENGDDLDGAIAALRRACKLVSGHLSSLHKLADALVARSERVTGAESETDLKRAAEVYYQLARAVPRADATPLLMHALALAPEHARAGALLHELRGHAAVGGDELLRGPHAAVSQLVVDQRATRQMRSPLVDVRPESVSPPPAEEPLPAALRDETPATADQTNALSTSDLQPIRREQQANRTMALSMEELIPLRNLETRSSPPPVPADAIRVSPPPDVAPPAIDAAPATVEVAPPIVELEAVRTLPPPTAAEELPEPSDAARTEAAEHARIELGPPPARVVVELAQLTPVSPLPPRQIGEPTRAHAAWPAPILASELEAPYDDEESIDEAPQPVVPPRARIVDALEVDPSRVDLEVNLGATTESNLYVDMGDRLADGGVLVATYQALPANTLITLHITLPGGLHADAQGRVALRRDSLDAFEDPAPGVCIAFEAITGEALALLERFAAKRAPWLIDDE